MSPSSTQNSQRRPALISELAEQARTINLDDNASLKSILRLAERERRAATDAFERKDLESSFVAFAKAASLILEKIPNHRDFHNTLTSTQRSNLALNGQEILDNLGQLKPILLERYEKWVHQHPDGLPDHTPTPSRRPDPPPELSDSLHDMKLEAFNQAIQEQDKKVQVELDLWKRQRQTPELSTRPDPRAQSAVNAARLAAGIPEPIGPRQSNSESRYYSAPSSANGVTNHSSGFTQPYRAGPSYQSTSPAFAMPSPSTIAYPTPSTIQAPTAIRSRPPSFMDQPNGPPTLLMPLENPSKYEGDSTDSEAFGNGHYDRRLKHAQKVNDSHHHARPLRSPSYPPPVTTTSPPPTESRIQYPQLMSKHQMSQGYVPSLNSMFTPRPGQTITSTSLLFDHKNPPRPEGQLYPSNMLPPPSLQPTYSQPISHPEGPRPNPSQVSYSHSTTPVKPSPSQIQPPPPKHPPSESSPNRPPGSDLRNVSLPRDCLPRFLAIAKANTAVNKETCGLLLGKDKGNKFVVTTLLIPKQHATSDTCTMDEEELVLQFTEERSLITLGWIHTHPSQSCFMSSVDLHTHSGFQCMLPESFAVVCAPKSTPNFGIFRLTDPPGLKIILNCTAKEAFHPHPDEPIYTDADKGHVQMKDISLEIVDLRR